MFDLDLEVEETENTPMPITKDQFIEKTKAMLRVIMDGYTSHWSNKFNENDESEENVCLRCNGFTQIEQGGDSVDCYLCNGTGVNSERVFDHDGFLEFMEHTVMFGNEPFLELMECEIIPS